MLKITGRFYRFIDTYPISVVMDVIPQASSRFPQNIQRMIGNANKIPSLTHRKMIFQIKRVGLLIHIFHNRGDIMREKIRGNEV